MILGIAGALAVAGVPVEVILAGIAALFLISLLVNWPRRTIAAERRNTPPNCHICKAPIDSGNKLCTSCRTHLHERLKEERERYNTDPKYRQRLDSLMGGVKLFGETHDEEGK